RDGRAAARRRGAPDADGDPRAPGPRRARLVGGARAHPRRDSGDGARVARRVEGPDGPGRRAARRRAPARPDPARSGRPAPRSQEAPVRLRPRDVGTVARALTGAAARGGPSAVRGRDPPRGAPPRARWTPGRGTVALPDRDLAVRRLS